MTGGGSSTKYAVPSEGGRGGGGRSATAIRGKSIHSGGSKRGPSDLQFMYEVGIRCMPPMVDLLDTPASRVLLPRVHKRFMRFMRATFHIFSNVNRVCIIVIFAMWAAPAEFGRVITPIVALGCFPVLFLSIVLMSAELLELLLQQHEFWFFTITNASNWIIASVLFNDARILGCIACFFLTQLVILMDANFRTVITATRSCVLWVPAICVIITVCATRTVDIDPERFRKVIPHNKIDFTLANSFLNNNMTLMIFVVRKTFRRRHILKPEFLVNRILPCSVLRCDLVLQRMQTSDEAGRSRYEVFQSVRESHGISDTVEYELNVSDARSSRYRSRRSTANTRESRVFAPVTSTSRRASQQHQVSNSQQHPPTFPQPPRNRSSRQLLHVVMPTLAFLDLRNTLLPPWTPSKQLPLLLSVAHYLCGGVGLLLAAFTMYLPAANDRSESSVHGDTLAEHRMYALVPALSLVFTTIFFAPFLASCQRDIVRALRRNFDFMFSSFQFTIGCLCLADMLAWDYRCVALVSWVQWFHWILLWDALLPASRERFRFKKIYGTPVLVSIMLGLLWIVYSLFFSSYDALLDRTITSVDWGAFRLSIRTSTFLVGRLNTILTWSLRLVWKAIRSQEDELMLIRGSLEYHTPLEIFPVLKQSAKSKDKQLVMPLESTKE